MTYGTMFHEIAQRYALDWRILAAQAYVESSFDSVALGAQGDLGLMQIQPATWREWAPTVEVADPFDSYSNVLVAATYVDYLRTTLSNRGHPELEWTLVAYNWGIDKVLQHLESGQGWQELAPARQAYATEILRLAATIPAENE
jgi:membrane-bound lytic murein transglycosylase F